MQTDRDYGLKQFNQADYGSLLIATIAQKGIVRGLKAFATDDKDRVDYFVTLGPLTEYEGKGKVPAVYDPIALRNRPVVDITNSCRFLPSLAPNDILPELPSTANSLGLAFLLEDSILLGVRFSTGGGSWSTSYLNMETGELLPQIEHDHVYATRRWRLVSTSQHGEATSLFEFAKP